jgi:hypothetical protein
MKRLIYRAAKSIKRLLTSDWPVVKCKKGFEPKIIFLITPPNSGSTAISQVFINSLNVDQIGKRGEGQWLIKGLCSSDRWDRKKYINKKSVRSVWLKECFKKYEDNGAMYFIEKSPPNMMRIELLQSIFPNHILISNNRDPYASVSSLLYRYTKDINKISDEARVKSVEIIVKAWIARSLVLRKIINKQNVQHVPYEKFCDKPYLLQESIDNSNFNGAIKLNFESSLKVKDYKPQPIMNLNEKQINKLTETDIEIINESLKSHEELLSFFGYGLR